MINEISIFNYKSVVSQRFSLARVNVFVGRSGSGKTNILEAIALAAAAHDNTLDTGSLQSRGIRVEKPSLMIHSSGNYGKEIEIEWCERQSTRKAKLTCDHLDDIHASWKDISWIDPAYVEKMNGLIQFIGDGMDAEQYPFDDETKNAVLNAAFRGSRNFRDYVIYHLNIDALREGTSKSPTYPLGISGEGLQQVLSTFDEEQLQELNDRCHGKYVPENMTGNIDAEVLCQFFYIALLICRQAPAFFAIDQIETMLAPASCGDLLTTITQLAVKNNKQVLITTSQPAIVHGMNLADPEQKLFLVKQAEEGQTIVKELTDKILIEI